MLTSRAVRHGDHLSVICLGYPRNFVSKLCHSSSSGFRIPREDRTLKQEVAKANCTIARLCKEGRICEARQMFDEMPERDVISWTALISGYTKCGRVEEARGLFDRVDAEKNVVTWTAMVSGYSRTRRLLEARRMFDEMPERNVVAWNTMIDGYVKNCMMEEALELFESMEERNLVSWNIVISGLMNSGRLDEAMTFVNRMPKKNVVSWTILVSGLARNGRIDEAIWLFDQMTERNAVTWNVMIAGYVQNMRPDEAYSLFQEMPERNAHTWNIMIDGFIQNNEFEKAKNLFSLMPLKTVVSWTTMINGFVQCGECEEGLKMFCLMQRDGRSRPNEGTFVSVLSACSNVAGLSQGMQVHQVITKSVYQVSAFVLSSLINMYSKCGEPENARRIFHSELRRDRDLVSWNSMISAYAHHGRGRDAITLFREMQDSNCDPNSATFIALLSACSHAGLVEEGLQFFELLLKDESIQLKEAHYTCIIDLYGRAGRLDEAFDLISKLPYKASSHTLGALLSGCSIHGTPDTRKLVADEVSQGHRDSDALVSKMKKQPGTSWIEVGNKFHVFLAGNRCHEHSQIMNILLLNLHHEMMMGSKR